MEGFMLSSSYFKTISQILILAMLHLCWLTSYGYAEMVPTESAVQSQVQDDRQRLLNLLDRQEVVEELQKYDISKVEAVARINSLTDEEVTKIAGKLDELEAGGYIVDAALGGFIMAYWVFISMVVCAIKEPYCWIFDCELTWNACVKSISFSKMIDGSAFSGMMGGSGRARGTEETYDNSEEYHGSSSKEMQTKANCYSRCGDNYHACINSDMDIQCEDTKQVCFQMCEKSKKITIGGEEMCLKWETNYYVPCKELQNEGDNPCISDCESTFNECYTLANGDVDEEQKCKGSQNQCDRQCSRGTRLKERKWCQNPTTNEYVLCEEHQQ
jgi:Family of unknown function (DUF6627)